MKDKSIDANDIARFPWADVRENVHAHNISDDGFLCSNCSFGDFGGFMKYKPRFCPNCGADMRGKRREDVEETN